MRIPAHAAVNETVALGGHARGLVNAVLRRALREKAALERKLEEAPISTRTSHPDFLLQRWIAGFGAEATEELCEWNNQPAEVYVRANGLRVTSGELLRTAPDAERSHFHPKAIRARRLPLSWIVSGLCYVQDPSTLMACDLMAPEPGETVLDACAAPGGKTAHILEIADADLVALDNDETRLTRVRSTLTRLQLDAKIVCGDAAHVDAWWDGKPFDRILADVPCSASGVVRRHPDIKWLRRPDDIARFAQRQSDILDALWQTLAIDGKLLYATCSVFREENHEQLERFLARHHDARHLTLPAPHTNAQQLAGQILPDERHDGFFYALLQKV
jgi:16S rRNA (cytosine967-C5)-methyltransferase